MIRRRPLPVLRRLHRPSRYLGDVQTTTVTALADGTYTGNEQNGCTFTGKVTVRTHGNVFDQSITFGGAPCFVAGSTFQGIVYFDIPTVDCI